MREASAWLGSSAAAVTTIGTAADGRFAVGTDDALLRWLDEDGEETARRGFRTPVACVRPGLADGATALYLVSGDYLLVDAELGLRRHWRMPGVGYFPLHPLDDGRWLATATRADGQRGAIRFDSVVDDRTHTVPLFDELVTTLHAPEGGNHVLTGDLLGNVARIDLPAFDVVRLGAVDARLMAAQETPASDASFAGLSDGTLLASLGPRLAAVPLRGSRHGIDAVFPTRDGTVTTWSQHGELLVHRVRPLADPVLGIRPLTATHAAHSPTDDALAIADAGRVTVVDVHADGSATRRFILELTDTRCELVRFSPDGSRLAVCGVDGSVRIHDATTGDEERAFPARRKCLAAIWGPHGRRVLTTGVDDFADVFDVATGNVGRIEVPGGPSQALLRWCDDRLVALTASGDLCALDVADDRVTASTIAGGCGAIATDPSRGRLAVFRDGHIELRTSGAETRVVPGTTTGAPPVALGLLPDGERLLVGDRDGAAWIVALADGSRRRFGSPTAPVHRFVWNATATRIAAAGLNGSVHVHDGHGRTLCTLPARPPFPTALGFDARDRLLVVGGSARRISLWPTRDDDLLALAARGAAAARDARELAPWNELLHRASATPEDELEPPGERERHR